MTVGGGVGHSHSHLVPSASGKNAVTYNESLTPRK